MVIFNKRKSKVKIFSSERKLDSCLNKQISQAKEVLRNFQRNLRQNMGANFLEDLEDLELGRRDERERQYNPIVEAAYILRNPAGNAIKRTNAMNRERREVNWAKVRPMLFQVLTGRQGERCDCGEGKEKLVFVVSLTGMPIQTYATSIYKY